VLLASLGFADRGIAGDNPFEVHFAHFATGEGYLTTFTLMNTGTTTATGFLQRYDSMGRPLNSIQVSVAPRGVNSLTLGSGGPPILTGWATYSGSGGKVSGVATFQRYQSGALKTAAGVLSSRPFLSATIPAGFSIPDEQYVGYALANPGTTDVTVRIAVYSAEGIPAAEPFKLTLGPGQQKARFLHENFPDWDYFDGTLVVTSDSGSPFLATALSQIKGLLTVLPVQEN
jgi:hypothetical protein